MNLHVAHRSSPKPGEHVNGDAVFVRRDEDGSALLAIIDGLGHGPIAAEASQAAITRLETTALKTSVAGVMQLLHEDLRRTRGAAATVCMIRGRTLEACAVGNVQLWCTKPLPLVVSPGIVGHRVSTFRSCSYELKSAARIALASDGISTRVRLDEFAKLSPTQACDAIFLQYRRADDDATILVADLDG